MIPRILQWMMQLECGSCSNVFNTVHFSLPSKTAGINVTYSMAANHLSTAVSALPEYISRNRNISGLGAHDPNDKDSTKQGSVAIYNANSSINTGHIPNWQGLSKSDKDIVQAERKRLGIKFNPKSIGNQQSYANNVNRLKQVTQQNKKY